MQGALYVVVDHAARMDVREHIRHRVQDGGDIEDGERMKPAVSSYPAHTTP